MSTPAEDAKWTAERSGPDSALNQKEKTPSKEPATPETKARRRIEDILDMMVGVGNTVYETNMTDDTDRDKLYLRTMEVFSDALAEVLKEVLELPPK